MIFGRRPVLEAFAAGKTVDRIFIQKGFKGELAEELTEACRHISLKPNVVPVEKLNRLTRKNHQGVVAFLSPVPFHHLEDLLPGIFESGANPLLLLLDGITDVRNFGALTRSAEAAGVHAVVIPEKGAAPLNQDAVKTSTGALFHLPVCKVKSLIKAVEFLQLSGLQICACTEKSDALIYDADLTLPSAIVMGAEDLGVSPTILRQADRRVGIPMQGKIGSLNVSVAGGIVLFEAVRQRQGS
ncbi:MAG: 23S rRNA (guanosine(2251)-2'-O)-methyltransferase RlmB [Salibacteraceae bacterium]